MTNTRAQMIEILLYAVAVWASYEMAKTPDQRVATRLARYLFTARACGWLAYNVGQLGIRAELAYYQETAR